MGNLIDIPACSTLRTLTQAQFVHLLSGVDEESVATPAAATPTVITGYTEWVGGPARGWSLGWDWKLDPVSVPAVLRRTSPPRTSLILVNIHGAEFQARYAERILCEYINRLPWQQCVLDYIAMRYRA